MAASAPAARDEYKFFGSKNRKTRKVPAAAAAAGSSAFVATDEFEYAAQSPPTATTPSRKKQKASTVQSPLTATTPSRKKQKEQEALVSPELFVSESNPAFDLSF